MAANSTPGEEYAKEDILIDVLPKHSFLSDVRSHDFKDRTKGEAAMSETSDAVQKSVPCICSQRWILAYVGFFGFILVTMVRVNFSVAIVCMVKASNSSSANSNLNSNSTVSFDNNCEDATSSDVNYPGAEFDWDKSTTSLMLSAYFYGYIVTQIPGGLLADKYGGRRVFGTSIVISAICTLLLPVCARAKLELVYFLRVTLGVVAAVSFPSVHSMWGRWAPPLERSKLMAVCYSGSMVGTILTFPLSGFLCAEGFDNGWGSIFYISGACGLVWAVVWFLITADTPQKHPRISEEEKNYIITSIGAVGNEEVKSVPWKEMIKSPAVLACITAHVCNNWTNYTLLTSLPTFFREALKFDLKSNALLAAIPYICQTTVAVISGQVADWLRSRKILSTTAVRRIFQVAAFLGAGSFLIATGYITCDRRYIAVLLLSLAISFLGFSRVGYIVNHVDFAPRYAGVVLGITNTMATIPGMVAPYVAGLLTPNQTAEEWQYVFILCGAFAAFGALIFGIFARGEEQSWARHADISKEMDLITKPKSVDTRL